MLHHAEARHLETLLERAQCLAVLAEQLVEQSPPGRIGEGPEYVVHPQMIGDSMVTCTSNCFDSTPISKRSTAKIAAAARTRWVEHPA